MGKFKNSKETKTTKYKRKRKMSRIDSVLFDVLQGDFFGPNANMYYHLSPQSTTCKMMKGCKNTKETNDRIVKPISNFIEKENEYQIEIELPGISKNTVNIELHDGLLTVSTNDKEENEFVQVDSSKGEGNSSEDKMESQDDEIIFQHIERQVGSYKRIFKVNKTVTPEDIMTSFNNGVLSLKVTKRKPESNHFKIDIQ